VDIQQLTSLGGLAISLVGGGVSGYFIKYFLDKKQQFTTENAKVKRDNYRKFVELYINQLNSPQTELVKEMRDFYKEYVLYGSPGVIKSMSKLFQHFYKQPIIETKRQQRTMLRMLARVFKAMRKDLGLSNRTLGYDGEILLRTLINDYDSVMYSRFRLWLQRLKNSILGIAYKKAG